MVININTNCDKTYNVSCDITFYGSDKSKDFEAMDYVLETGSIDVIIEEYKKLEQALYEVIMREER